jgi:hypothetical protein
MFAPGGLAHLVIKALRAKYMPGDVFTKVELSQMLSKVKTKKDDEPSMLFKQLSAIENRFNKPVQSIPEDDLIAAVLTAAPKDYVSILTAEQRSKGKALQLTDLEPAMTQHWGQTVGTLNAAEEGNEVTLLAFKTEFVIIVKHRDIGRTNAPKSRIGTTEDETTTTTTTKTFLVVTKKITNLKEVATIAKNRGMPKQRAGCSPAMPTRGQHGLSHEKMPQRLELQPMRLAIG